MTSLKRKMFTAFSSHLIEKVPGIVKVERYYQQDQNPEKQLGEFSNTVHIEIEEIDWQAREEQSRGRQKLGLATVNFYVNVLNPADSYRTPNDDSETLEDSLDDFDFEQEVWQALKDFTNTCGGIQLLRLIRTQEIAKDDLLFIHKIVAEADVCDWNATC